MSKKGKTETTPEAPKAVTAKAAPALAAAAPAGPVVYLGPTIEKVVQHGTVFDGDLPALLQARIEEQPFISGLIFPISQYAIQAAEVGKKGSALYNIAKAVNTK